MCFRAYRKGLHHRAEQIPRAHIKGRACVCTRGSKGSCRGHDENRERRAMARVRPAGRSWRNPYPRERTGLFHHAGKGKPDTVRGCHNGGSSGDGQRRGCRIRGLAGKLRAERVHAGHSIQLHPVMQASCGGDTLVQQELRGGNNREQGEDAPQPVQLAYAGHGAEPLHRI